MFVNSIENMVPVLLECDHRCTYKRRIDLFESHVIIKCMVDDDFENCFIDQTMS